MSWCGPWGTTETASAATTANFEFRDSRCIGAPLPGVTLKLVPEDADTYEVRVRGANVTPGFFRRPELGATTFDAEGFYCPGDAVSFADPADPAAGLLFRGRLAEDFKLSTGTFVPVGALRTALLSAAPMLADAVLTGEDHDEVGDGGRRLAGARRAPGADRGHAQHRRRFGNERRAAAGPRSPTEPGRGRDHG